MRNVLTIMAIVLVVVAVINFGATLADSARRSGDPASPGYVAQPNTTCLTWPLGMAAGIYLLFQYIFPAGLYYTKREAIADQAQTIQQSGLPIASMVTGGRIGVFNVTGPFLKATLYPGGLIVKPVGLPPVPIPTTTIRSAVYVDSGFNRGIEIKHSSRQVAGPIFLSCSSDSNLWWSLETLVRTGHTLEEQAPAAGNTPEPVARRDAIQPPPSERHSWVGGTAESQRYGKVTQKADQVSKPVSNDDF
jgi:hypothetical protein